MNNELYHWKYISREKVGNKWQYKYATDKNSNSTGSTATDTSSKYGKASNWKYLKREKVNGKWQYTYDKAKQYINDKIGVTAKANAAKAKIEYDNAKTREKFAKNQATNTRETLQATEKKASGATKAGYDAALKTINASLKYDNAMRDRYPSYTDDEGHTHYKWNQPTSKYKNASSEEKERMDAAADKAYKEWEQAYTDMHRTGRAYDKFQNEDVPALKEKLKSDNVTTMNAYQERQEAAKAYVKAQNEWMNSPLYKFEKVSEKMKETADKASEKMSDAVDSAKDYLSKLFKRKTAPEPKLSSPNETVLKENILYEDILYEDIIKGDVIEEKKIEEKKIGETSVKQKEIKQKEIKQETIEQDVVVDTTITRKKATEALEKIKEEYSERVKEDTAMYEKAKELEKSSDTEAFKKAKAEYEEFAKETYEIRDRKDAAVRAKKTLEDTLDEIEHDLDVINSFTQTEETRKKKQEYYDQIDEAIEEYYKAINGK